jgi:hypothetical protein
MTKEENLIGNRISWDGLRQHEQFKIEPLISFSFESHPPPMIQKEAKEKNTSLAVL